MIYKHRLCITAFGGRSGLSEWKICVCVCVGCSWGWVCVLGYVCWVCVCVWWCVGVCVVNVWKSLNYFRTFDHPVCSNPNKVGQPNYIILWKVNITSFKISICFTCSSFTKKKKNLQDTKYGDQNIYILWFYTLIYPVFLCSY